MSKANNLIAEILGILIKLAFMITLFILVYNTNKRTKLIQKRTRFLIERDTLIIREISGKEYYYR